MSGRPPFIPTRDMRKLVQALAGMGMSHDQIAKVIENPATGRPISHVTLRAKFRAELDNGMAQVDALAYMAIAKNLSSDNPAVRFQAAAFYLERRRGWNVPATSLDRGKIETGDGEIDTTEAAKAIMSIFDRARERKRLAQG